MTLRLSQQQVSGLFTGVNFHKYKAKRCEIDGYKFASLAEGSRYTELKLLQKNGKIGELVLQPRFPIPGKTKKVLFTYIADFKYFSLSKGEEIIEDVKGYLTPVYKLKKKIIEDYYGIKITEVLV